MFRIKKTKYIYKKLQIKYIFFFIYSCFLFVLKNTYCEGFLFYDELINKNLYKMIDIFNMPTYFLC
jgi:hypothetical protein